MAISVKEATASRQQLLKDRATLQKQIDDLRKKSRLTLGSTERVELVKKMKGL